MIELGATLQRNCRSQLHNEAHPGWFLVFPQNRPKKKGTKYISSWWYLQLASLFVIIYNSLLIMNLNYQTQNKIFYLMSFAYNIVHSFSSGGTDFSTGVKPQGLGGFLENKDDLLSKKLANDWRVRLSSELFWWFLGSCSFEPLSLLPKLGISLLNRLLSSPLAGVTTVSSPCSSVFTTSSGLSSIISTVS